MTATENTTDLRAAALDARAAAGAASKTRLEHKRQCGDCRGGLAHSCEEGWALANATLDAAEGAWKAHAAALPPGTRVVYSGTKADDHGDGWTVEGVSAGCLGSGYTIVRDGRTLSRVRLEHLAEE